MGILGNIFKSKDTRPEKYDTTESVGERPHLKAIHGIRALVIGQITHAKRYRATFSG